MPRGRGRVGSPGVGSSECGQDPTRPYSYSIPTGLGPLLFLIYMNDNIIDLYHNINVDLSNLVDWFRSNKLALNTTKTNFMLFTSSNNIPTN